MTSEIEIFRTFIATDNDYALGQSATEQEIANFEAKYKVSLPDDVKEYFLKLNGASCHGGFIALEPLDEWVLMADYKYSTPEYFNQFVSDTSKYFRFVCN